MENPIKENRIVCDKTFAVRLLDFAESVTVADACSEDEKESFVHYAKRLLEYQCITAESAEEIEYLQRVGVYEKYTTPILETQDGFKITKFENCKIFSCLKNTNKNDQILEYNVRQFREERIKIKSNRLYFKHKENCEKYIEFNIPLYSKQDLKNAQVLDQVVFTQPRT